LRQRIQLENALDAQLDKSLGRLQIVREARLVRDKLRQSQEVSVGNSPSVQSPAKHDQQVGPAVVAKLSDDDDDDDGSIDDLTVEDLADETDSKPTILHPPDELDEWDSKE
jgi:hypothetical protein